MYAHLRKDNSNVFYVGKGKNRRSKIFTGRNNYWQKVVKKAGGFIDKIIAHKLSEQEAFILEKKLISHYTNMGLKLTNLTIRCKSNVNPFFPK